MTKKEIEQIKGAFAAIIGQPMRNLTRSGAKFIIDFGELIELSSFVFDENGSLALGANGKPIPTTKMRGQYGIDSLCSMRLTCGNEVILASSDIFLPNEEQSNKEGFVWDTFDWLTHGNTFFDELLATHFRGEFDGYIVKSVKVKKFGDLTITFENGFVLEFFTDTADLSEIWRFGETNSTHSLVVTSKGILDESAL